MSCRIGDWEVRVVVVVVVVWEGYVLALGRRMGKISTFPSLPQGRNLSIFLSP